MSIPRETFACEKGGKFFFKETVVNPREITPVFPICAQQFSRYLEVYLSFFAVIQNSYVSHFLLEHLKVLCGTLRFRGSVFEERGSTFEFENDVHIQGGSNMTGTDCV